MNSKFYVTDTVDGTVITLDEKGVKSVVLSGLNQPAGIAFDKSNKPYVASTGDDTVVTFNRGGVRTIFASGLNKPSDLKFDASGNLFVANGGDGSILKLTPQGQVSTFCGGAGVGSESCLVFGPDGNLYATTSHVIKKISPSGLASDYQILPNSFYGLAFDRSGVLFASFQNSSGILAYPSGPSVNVGGQNANPAGMAFDRDNQLYVTFGQSLRIYNFQSQTWSAPFTGFSRVQHIALEHGPDAPKNLRIVGGS